MFSIVEVKEGHSFTDLLSLEDAKNQLNIIDFEEHDDYITGLIPVAFQLVEKATGQLFLPSVVTCRFVGNELPSFVPFVPWSGVKSVSGPDFDLAYDFDHITGEFALTEHFSGKGTLVYDAGYDDPARIPPGLLHIVKMVISELYRHRGETTSENVKTIPMSVKSLANAYKWGHL